VTRLRDGRSGGSISSRGRDLFLFATASTQSIKRITGALYLEGVKRPGREPDHSPPSSAEFKDARSYDSPPHMPSGRGAWFSIGFSIACGILTKQRRLYLYLTI
jgi:hypothetical protein